MKASMVRIPIDTEKEINAYANEKGLVFATAIRCIVVEYFTIQKIIKLTPEQTKQVHNASLQVR